MKKIVLTTGILGFLLTIPSMGSCKCACINGSVQAVCTSSIDLEPICAPRICPIVTPSIEPIQTPRIPPIGTKSCRQVQVYNDYKRKYEWKTVCR